jgi:F-type H+-transporting ATPase subunit b
MSEQQKSSPLATYGGFIGGAVLMVAGTWASRNYHNDFIQKLNDQGIPIDIGKTVAVIGVLLFVFPVVKFFFLNDLMGSMNARNQQLESTFAEAESLRAEMKQMRNDYEARLAQTEANAREQIQNQIKEAQNLRQQLMSEAAERADALVKQAQIEIDQEKIAAIQTIRTHVVDLTLAAAEKVIGENMDTAKNRRLVAEFIDTVEVAS